MDSLANFNSTVHTDDVLKYIHYNIGDSRRVVEVHYYQGNNYFDIVTYEKSPSGNYSKVSNKCLRISLELLAVFIDNLDAILDAVSILSAGGETELKIHLGQLIYVRIDKGVRCVDIRKHFIPSNLEVSEDNLKPGFPGVGLRITEFNNFANLLPQLINLTEVKNIIPCSRKVEHDVQNCKTCNPQRIFYP